jgi:hypothetical protein
LDEKTVNTPVAVFKRMYKNKTVSDSRGVDYGWKSALFHFSMGAEQSFHQPG